MILQQLIRSWQKNGIMREITTLSQQVLPMGIVTVCGGSVNTVMNGILRPMLALVPKRAALFVQGKDHLCQNREYHFTLNQFALWNDGHELWAVK